VTLDIRIVTGSSAPIYRQIIDCVGRAVASGTARPGEQMPSVRVLAERLVVNPNTVARAYTDLTRAGILESQPGRGLFIADRRQMLSDPERERRLDAAVGEFVNATALLDFTREEILDRLSKAIDTLGAVDGDAPVSKERTDDV